MTTPEIYRLRRESGDANRIANATVQAGLARPVGSAVPPDDLDAQLHAHERWLAYTDATPDWRRGALGTV